ncbi:hypothetical protein WJX74_002329 [Apatococcus lobatus]|uniref:JmjC domain-containing protein n=2 Tax=Apatococcus TaxID=904362 RepID=A0AAW1S085_9CHLO
MTTPVSPTVPQGPFPPPQEFQQANAEYARTTVGEEDLQAFKDLNLTQQPDYKAGDKHKAYERQESTDSTTSMDSEYEDGPPRQEEFGDYEADGKFIENQGPQLVKLFPKFRLKKYLKHLILPSESDTPLQFYTKRIGFNNIVVMNGFSKEGPVAYHIDVQKVSFGWNVLIHKGPNAEGPCIMKLTKKKAIWDKNAQMVITDQQVPPTGLDTILKHPHLCTTNINVFEYAGRKYEWYHRRLVGDVYICYDAESRDVMAMCKLRFDIKAVKQIITAWGLRINGEIEIYDKAKFMSDIIIATLMAELEWRKHQNKWFQILLWIVTSP